MRTSPRSLICVMAVGFLLVVVATSPAGDFTDWLLGKSGVGANRCDWSLCRCCDDYCGKCLPCTPRVCPQECPDYCSKLRPCTPRLCPQCCPNDCRKAVPCPPPFRCGNFCATAPSATVCAHCGAKLAQGEGTVLAATGKKTSVK